MFEGKGISARAAARVTLAVALTGLGTLTPDLDPTSGARSTAHAAGSIDTLEPYAWGSVQTGTGAHLAWASPVSGDGTLTTTRPSGGGSLGAAITAGAPDTKLSSLIAFGGGEVVTFAEGSSTYSVAAHMIAVVDPGDGTHELWAWGNNSYGQLGTGTRVATQTPTRVAWTPASGERVVALSVGEGHSLMLTDTAGVRTAYSWGRNNVGQLGISAIPMSSSGVKTTPRIIPTLVGEGIVDIAAGRFHSVAVDDDGYAWVWGYDAATNVTSYGDLGVSGTLSRAVPVRLTDDTLIRRRATPISYSVTNNVVTVTNADRDYFDAGNTVTTTGTGIDILDTTATITKVTATTYSHTAQPNVASTPATGAIALTNTTATPSAATITSNTARLTVAAGHDIRTGNRIRVDVGDPAFDGERTVTNRNTTWIEFRSQPDTASTPAPSGTITLGTRTLTPTAATITSNTVRLTVESGHDIGIGNRIRVDLGDPAFDGERTVTGRGSTWIEYRSQPDVASTPAPNAATATHTATAPVSVTSRSITSNVASLTVTAGHPFKVGSRITVATGDATFDGTHTVTSLSGNTSVRYALTAGNVVATATTGTATLVDPTATITDYSITGNVVTVTTSATHNLREGNTITVAGLGGIGGNLDGPKTVLAGATGTTFSFTAEANRSSAAVTGTVDVLTDTDTTSSYSITNNTATVTISNGHDFAVGNRITVAGMGGIGGNLDGETAITAIGASTISFTVEEDRSSTAVTGTVDIIDDTDTVTAYSITNNTATLTVTTGHSFEVGNQIVVTGMGGLDGNLDGEKTITGVTATAIQYQAQPNVPSTTITAVSPEAVVSDCSASCPTAPTDLVDVAAGSGFTMARTASGGVITWGYTYSNSYGRLGRTGDNRPAAVTLPTGCIADQIEASPYNGAVVCADERIVTWGYNGHYQLGTNSTAASVTTPTLVSGLSLSSGETIIDIDSDAPGSTVLTSTGRVLSWGRGIYGRNGIGSTSNQRTVQVATRIDPPTGATPTALFSNYYTSGVADSDGVAWTWGYGAGAGLPGHGVASPSTATFNRVGVDPSTRIERIDTTYYSTVALLSDGSMWSWGTKATSSGLYFLGDGTTGSRLTPARIPLPVGLDTSLAADTVTGLDCSYTHCLITTSNGSIYGWGDGTSRQLSPGSTTATKADRTSPTLITSGLTNPIVAAGYGYSLYADIGAAGTGGTLKAWGSNSYRRASPTTSTTGLLTAFNEVRDMSVPASPVAVTDVIAVAAGNTHTVALRANGTLMAWGRNNVGQLGTGTTDTTIYYSEPVLPGGRTAASLHVEGDHVLVRATDGTLHGWGRNTNGVLGTGGLTNVLTPTHAAVGHTFARIDTSGYPTNKHVQTAVGLTTDGTVLAWGANSYGQLGRTDRPASTNGYSATPLVVQATDGTDLTGVDAVVTGGGWSAGFHRPPALAPSEPLSPSATSPAAGTIDLTWTAPSSPRGLVGYVITVSRSGTVVFTAGAGASATSVTLAAPTVDIVDGVEHTITISAVNDAGTSAPSSPVTATPTGLPTTPRNLVVTPVAGGIDIAFDTPTGDGGLPILDFTVTAHPVTCGSNEIITVPVGADPRTGSMTTGAGGLIDGCEYMISVVAQNSNGFGPAATAVDVVIPGRPAAPTITAAVGLLTGASITFAAPDDDGGAAILSHVVTLYDTGTTTVAGSVVVPAGTEPLTGTVTGLTDGNVYDAVVRSSQAADGLSLLGTASAAVAVTAGRPVAPTGVTLDPSATRTLTVTWTPVADAPGITVTGYQTRTTVGATVGSAVARTCTTVPCSVTIGSLTNGTPTTIEVRAVSAGGVGPWSTAVTATPRTVPAAPTTLELTPTDGTAAIGFVAPTDTGGDDLDAYTVTITPTAGGDPVYEGTLAAIETFTAVEGLTNGTSYTVSVKARNRAGLSPALTGTVTPATVPGAPSGVQVRPGSIIVEWEAPTDNGGDSVDHYEITLTDTDGISTTVETTSSATCSTTARTCTISTVYTATSSALDPPTLVTIPADMEYRVSVAAVNGQGSGASTTEAVIISSQPSEPTAAAATGGLTAVAVCWTAPATVPATRTITSYRLRFTAGSDTSDVVVAVGDLAPADGCTAPSLGHVVTAFDDGSLPVAGTTYTVTVAASTSTEDPVFGLDSTAVTVTPYDLPGAAGEPSVTTSLTSATITWTAAGDNGEPIDSYTVTAEPGGADCTWTSGPLECTITGLADGVDHTFSIVASNDAGDGPVRRSSAVRIDATPPGAAWTLLGRDDTTTARLRLTFDEAITGFSAASDIDGVSGCTVTVDDVTSTTVDLTLACGAGDVTPVLAAGSVSDVAGNAGPIAAVTGPTITFSSPAPAPSPTPGPDPTPEPDPTAPESPGSPGSDPAGSTGGTTSDAADDAAGSGATFAGSTAGSSTEPSTSDQVVEARLPATGTEAGWMIRTALAILLLGIALLATSGRKRKVCTM
jgi:titin